MPSARECQLVLGAGHAHKGQATLLFHGVGGLVRPPVGIGANHRQQAGFATDYKHGRELQALGCVHCHKRNRPTRALEVIGIRNQRHLMEEIRQAGIRVFLVEIRRR